MKALKTTFLFACLVAAAGAASADDMMKKPDAMTKDGTMKPMTMQECKDHMAMAKKDGMKKDDAMMAKKDDASMKKDDAMMMKKDAMCADMMKSGMAASEPMKK